jgi:hypothetical protein
MFPNDNRAIDDWDLDEIKQFDICRPILFAFLVGLTARLFVNWTIY